MATTPPARRTAARRPIIDTAYIVELERDRDRTRKNLQSSMERTEQYRRHLEAVQAWLDLIA